MIENKSKYTRNNYLLIGLNRLWTLGSNLVVVYVVSTHLSAVEQGYFYAFQSLGASQFFFDLGIGFVLANVASRRVAKAHLEGCSDLGALSSVFVFSLKWSFAASLMLYSALFVAGKHMFPEGLQSIWNFYSFMVTLHMVFNTQLSILEGVGRVLAVSVVRSLQSTIFVAGLFVTTFQGMGLHALPWALLGSAIPVFVWLTSLLWATAIQVKPDAVDAIWWRRDILPFQWRVAISWISGYFVFQAPIPFLYKLVGPTEAGQIGLAMQIFQALTTLASILLSTRIKIWAQLSVEKRHHELRCDLWRVASLSVGAVVVFAVTLKVLLWLLFQVSPIYEERIVGNQAWLMLTLAASANQLFFCLNYFFRAQGREALWIVAVTAGLTAIFAAWLITPVLSIANVVMAYCAISILIHAGGSLLVYRAHVKS